MHKMAFLMLQFDPEGIRVQWERVKMKAYKLQFVMYSPSESTEPDKYMAEIPALPGCRVWGDTPEDAIDILQDVAAGIIETHIERGYDLPDEVKDALIVSGNSNELVVSV